jgi:hypothetical protein
MLLLNGCDSEECRQARRQNLPNRDQVCAASHGGSGGSGGGHGFFSSSGRSDTGGSGDHAVSRGGFGGSGHGGE